MDFKKGNTIYEQIAELVCEKILTEEWTSDNKINSVRELAAQIEVNPNTIMRAYGNLQDDGIIYNKRGIGFFVADGAKQIIEKRNKKAFIELELPDVFKKIEMLNLSFSEIEALYRQFISKQK
jgi:DNA-binding transcriptional regulator YhcF (GntR family)